MARPRALTLACAAGTTCLICLALVPAARAQVGETMIVPPVVPEGYSAGRNVSVRERSRPDFEAIGIRRGSFVILPNAEAGAGITSNTYLSPIDPVASPFAFLRGAVLARSNWSRHSLRISGEGEVRRFVGQSARNEDRWQASAVGRLDISGVLVLEGMLTAERDFENQFSGEALPTIAALSRYRRNFGSLKGRYTSGRVRGTWIVDRTSLDFSPLALRTGGFRDQSDRDRDISRATVQVEYAQTPSIALMGQVSFARTGFERNLISGAPNRDSDAVRALGGVNLDLAGRVRGTVSVGYTNRNYRSPLYSDASGFSFESRLEFFPTDLTTVSLGSRRTLEDSQIGNNGAFWNTNATFGIDHELLRNLILGATGQVGTQKYVDSGRRSESFILRGNARYLSSRRLEIRGAVSYGSRLPSADLPSNRFHEFRSEAGVTLKI
jgi:hypothetical protein